LAFNPSSVARVMIRATNWLGDAVMSLPAIRVIRETLPHAHLAVVARPWVGDLYAREKAIDRVIPYTAKSLVEKRAFAKRLRVERFDAAILLQNAFDAALMAWMAAIPRRIGYNRDGRGLLLTDAVRVPEPGDIPRHERFYYLEMLRRIGMIERFPECETIRLDGAADACAAGLRRMAELGIEGPAVGVSPGAAYGNAKRWFPERFAESARILASEACGRVLLFGSAAERDLCEQVARSISSSPVRNLAGETKLTEFIELAAACRVFLTNDSGAMHVASALGVPTVAVFGATDDVTTGPTGANAKVVREHAECSPCLLRECPIDHRCMTRVSAARVVEAARKLLANESAGIWTREAK
jgi:heptosyltransferase-2